MSPHPVSKSTIVPAAKSIVEADAACRPVKKATLLSFVDIQHTPNQHLHGSQRYKRGLDIAKNV